MKVSGQRVKYMRNIALFAAAALLAVASPVLACGEDTTCTGGKCEKKPKASAGHKPTRVASKHARVAVKTAKAHN
jgi:hypothetical protein